MAKWIDAFIQKWESTTESHIRQDAQMFVKTMEIYYDELEKSRLPEDIKKALLLSFMRRDYEKTSKD